MKDCKYRVKMKKEGYNRCSKDGSIRKSPCSCPHKALSWWQKFLSHFR